jgi:DMSO reductase anchor subunit
MRIPVAQSLRWVLGTSGVRRAVALGLLLSLATVVASAGELLDAAREKNYAAAVATWGVKRAYWRIVDQPLPLPRAAALGLPHERNARVFERPHTEANYLTKEMGFVLARRHSKKLRTLAVALLTVVPFVALLLFFVVPALAPATLLLAAATSALLGAFVERWLFFAEAKHLVSLYY